MKEKREQAINQRCENHFHESEGFSSADKNCNAGE
jgi:hypothetical protein